MLRQPMLTVIMPVYNMEKYLGRALEALAKQKDKNFKLLIVNDGSRMEAFLMLETLEWLM